MVRAASLIRKENKTVRQEDSREMATMFIHIHIRIHITKNLSCFATRAQRESRESSPFVGCWGRQADKIKINFLLGCE